LGRKINDAKYYNKNNTSQLNKPWTPPKGRIKTAIPVINKPVCHYKMISMIGVLNNSKEHFYVPKPIMTRANAAATTFQFSLTRGCFHQIVSDGKYDGEYW
jgi:hypothetical protein